MKRVSPPPGRSVSQVIKNMREQDVASSIVSEHDHQTISENRLNAHTEGARSNAYNKHGANAELSTFGKKAEDSVIYSEETSIEPSFNSSLARSTDIPMASSGQSSVYTNSATEMSDTTIDGQQLDDDIDSIVSVNEKYREVLNSRTPVSELDVDEYDRHTSALPTPVRMFDQHAGLSHVTVPPPPSINASQDTTSSVDGDRALAHPIDADVIIKPDLTLDSDDDQSMRPGVSNYTFLSEGNQYYFLCSRKSDYYYFCQNFSRILICAKHGILPINLLKDNLRKNWLQ